MESLSLATLSVQVLVKAHGSFIFIWYRLAQVSIAPQVLEHL